MCQFAAAGRIGLGGYLLPIPSFFQVYNYGGGNGDKDREIVYAEFTDIERVSKKRDVYCSDLEELVDRTSLLSIDDKWKFEKLKNAMRKRLIEFNSIECYYLFEEIFYNI